MLKNLKKKWKVGNLQLILILATFAIGGSFCGFCGRLFLGLFKISKASGWWYFPIYLVVITFFWPFCVIVVSLITGQYTFFKAYLIKMRKRIFKF